MDNISFVAHRRVATHIFVPTQPGISDSTQMWLIHPNGLAAALSKDQAAAV